MSRRQLVALDHTDAAVDHLRASGRRVPAHDGVYAMPPVLDDPPGRWMGAALTADGSVLSHASAGAA